MDYTTLGFSALMSIGFVNVITFFAPTIDSKLKIGLSFVFVFALSFVPVEIGNQIAQRVKDALEITLFTTGSYKLFQKVGGQ